MRKTAVLMVVIMLTVFAPAAAMAGPGGDRKALIETKVGTLFLFQKCQLPVPVDEIQADAFDEYGCPEVDGPWPILPTNRWGQMKYNLLGDKFKFSFEGKKLLAHTAYTLIYYPDPWPGKDLICLGTRKSNGAGNLQINGSMEIASGLPAEYDGNFKPASSTSGAVGAKIWLVLENDVDCIGSGVETDDCKGNPCMTGWTPQDYLFEGNLIIYQHQEQPTQK